MSSAYDIESVRQFLPILKHWTYLNTGTVGIMAEPVLDRHLENIADHERGGRATQSRAIEDNERARSAVAHLLDADPLHIAPNRNATGGVNFVAASFAFAAGDEVITSTEEHPAIVLPWSAACERAGATLRFFDLSHNPETLAANVRALVSPRTRLVAISHASSGTGARTPVEILRGILDPILDPNVAIMVDAAQSVGQFVVAVSALHADYVIGNGLKCLAGPKGSGFLWLSPAPAVEWSPPACIGDGTVEPRWTREYYQDDEQRPVQYSIAASRHEYDTRAWHTYGALVDAIDGQSFLG